MIYDSTFGIDVYEYEDRLHLIDLNYAKIHANFIDEMVEYMESIFQNPDDNVFFEKNESSGIGGAISKFIQGIINAINHLKHSINMEIQRRLFSEEYKNKLDKLKTNALIAENLGKKTVKMVDYRQVCTTYVQMVDELSKKAKKIADLKYLTMNGLTNDIQFFNDTVDSYEEKLEALMKEEHDYPVKEVISFIENEQKNGTILHTLDEAQKVFNEMLLDVEKVEDKEKVVGRNILSKKLSIIRKSANSFFKLIRKWTATLIAKIVFYFA